MLRADVILQQVFQDICILKHNVYSYLIYKLITSRFLILFSSHSRTISIDCHCTSSSTALVTYLVHADFKLYRDRITMSNSIASPITAQDVESHNRRASEVLAELKSLDDQIWENSRKRSHIHFELVGFLGVDSWVYPPPACFQVFEQIDEKMHEYEEAEHLYKEAEEKLNSLKDIQERAGGNPFLAGKKIVDVQVLDSLVADGAEFRKKHQQAKDYVSDADRLSKEWEDLRAKRVNLAVEAKRLNSYVEDCQAMANQLVKIEHPGVDIQA